MEEMEVDEKREIYDLSDHCLVRLSLKIKKNKQKKEKEETIYREIQTITRMAFIFLCKQKLITFIFWLHVKISIFLYLEQ